MAASLELPTVTQVIVITTQRTSILTNGQEDLLSFHSKHFNRPFSGPGGTLIQSGRSQDLNQAEEDYEDQDDDLGYYPDGTKRTLTDEQIAIFRHSEIQRLLLTKRREEEAAADRAADRMAVVLATRAEAKFQAESEAQAIDVQSSIDPVPAAAQVTTAEASDEDEGEIADVDDEEEYARFLEEERQAFKRDAEIKRKASREKTLQDDRSVSTRRRVRELDDGLGQARDNVELDY